MDTKASGDILSRPHYGETQTAALAGAGRGAHDGADGGADDDDPLQAEFEATGGQGVREDYLRGLVSDTDDLDAGLEQDRYESILFGTLPGEFMAGVEASRDEADHDCRDLVRHAARWLYGLGLREHTRALWALTDDAEGLRYRAGQHAVRLALYAANQTLWAMPAYARAMPAGVELTDLETVFDDESLERRLINRLGGVEYLRDLVRHEPKEYGVQLQAWETAVRARRILLALGRPPSARASLETRLGELTDAGLDDATARLYASLELQEVELIDRWAAGGLCVEGERTLRQLQAVLIDCWNEHVAGPSVGRAA